ncbi:MAG: hypothetical protein OXU61_00035 [Gammaproteobacteria bacterium]|nr:hypothetical protein [Gammaproteobacteria bacterium]
MITSISRTISRADKRPGKTGNSAAQTAGRLVTGGPAFLRGARAAQFPNAGGLAARGAYPESACSNR